jgi:hypothetical protein
VFATFRAEKPPPRDPNANGFVIGPAVIKHTHILSEALTPGACLNPLAVVPHGLGVRDGSLQINPGRQTAKASPVSGTKSLTVRCAQGCVP